MGEVRAERNKRTNGCSCRRCGCWPAAAGLLGCDMVQTSCENAERQSSLGRIGMVKVTLCRRPKWRYGYPDQVFKGRCKVNELRRKKVVLQRYAKVCT